MAATSVGSAILDFLIFFKTSKKHYSTTLFLPLTGVFFFSAKEDQNLKGYPKTTVRVDVHLQLNGNVISRTLSIAFVLVALRDRLLFPSPPSPTTHFPSLTARSWSLAVCAPRPLWQTSRSWWLTHQEPPLCGKFMVLFICVYHRRCSVLSFQAFVFWFHKL